MKQAVNGNGFLQFSILEGKELSWRLGNLSKLATDNWSVAYMCPPFATSQYNGQLQCCRLCSLHLWNRLDSCICKYNPASSVTSPVQFHFLIQTDILWWYFFLLSKINQKSMEKKETLKTKRTSAYLLLLLFKHLKLQFLFLRARMSYMDQGLQ